MVTKFVYEAVVVTLFIVLYDLKTTIYHKTLLTSLRIMVKIHFNDTALRHIAQYRSADHEGRLLYRTSKDSYRDRWFRLCGNLLFYFRTNEHGAVVDMSDPVGVLVLAACNVQMEKYGDRPFVFSVTFSGEEGRKHFFSGQSQQQCMQWVEALRGCAHSKLQTRLDSLRLQIKERTGSDPLLERRKVPILPRSGVSQSAGSAATFYVDSSSERRSPSAFTMIGPPVVPTRRAPNRPTTTQQLIQLVEPTAASDSAPVHTAATKSMTFSNWETFN